MAKTKYQNLQNAQSVICKLKAQKGAGKKVAKTTISKAKTALATAKKEYTADAKAKGKNATEIKATISRVTSVCK